MRLDQPHQTPRLLLRSLAASDATAAYLSWLEDPEINRYLESRFVKHTLASLASFIEHCNAGDTDLLLGICLHDGRHIGNIKLGPINPQHRYASIGLLIGDRACWGKGYATEAITGISRVGFEHLGLEKLYAGCYAGNQGSARAFLNAGYLEEGRQKSMWESAGHREDNILLGLTRADWLTAQQRAVRP